MPTMPLIKPSMFHFSDEPISSSSDLLTRDDFNSLTTGDSFNDLMPGADSNKLKLDVANGDVVSVETMLSRDKLDYDFDVTLVKSVARDLNKGRRGLVIREVLLNYNKLFDELSSDPGSVGLKLNFYVIRLKSDTFLVEGLLRDFIKRCKLHIHMLAKTNRSVYYVKQSRLLLSEIVKFNLKKGRVFKHIDDAILTYRSSSDGEFHLLEREIFSLREKVTFKSLVNKLSKCLALLESELQSSASGFGSGSGSVDIAEAVSPASAPTRFPSFLLFLTMRPSKAFSEDSSDVNELGVSIIEVIPDITTSPPWYLSDRFIVGLSLFVCICAVYLLLKNDDDGSNGPASPISKGLTELLSSESSDSEDFMWWGPSGQKRFAANPGIGESGVRLFGVTSLRFTYVFGLFLLKRLLGPDPMRNEKHSLGFFLV